MNLSGSRLTYYETFNDKDLDPFRRRGKADGGLCLPDPVPVPPGASGPPLDVLGPTEEEYVSRARADISEFMREVHAHRASYEADRDSKYQFVESFRSKREILTNEFNGRIEALRREKGDASPVYLQAKQAFDEANDHFRNLAANLSRPLSSFLSNYSYIFVLVILSLIEAPVNQPAVGMVFRESWLMSLLLAGSIGAILMFLAHVMGRLVRQARYSIANGLGTWLPNLLLFLLCLGVVLPTIWYLYLLRLDYFRLMSVHGSEDSGILFLLFNLAVFLVGLAVAYFHHDPNPEFQSAAEHTRKTRKIFHKHQRAHETARQELQALYDNRLVSMAREVDRLEGDVEVIIKGLANLERQKHGFVNRVLEVLSLQLSTYQAANVQARHERRIPCATPLPTHFTPGHIKAVVDRVRAEFI